MHSVLTEYALTTKDVGTLSYYHRLIGSLFTLTLTSTKIDLDGQFQRPPSDFLEVLEVIQSYGKATVNETSVKRAVPQPVLPVTQAGEGCRKIL